MTYQNQLIRILLLSLSFFLIPTSQTYSKGDFTTKVENKRKEVKVKKYKKKHTRFFKKLRKRFLKKETPPEERSPNTEGAILLFVLLSVFVIMGLVLGSSLLIQLGGVILLPFLLLAIRAVRKKEKKGILAVKIMLGILAGFVATAIYLILIRLF